MREKLLIVATITVSKLTKTGRGNSPNRHGAAISRSITFSMSAVVNRCTTSRDFRGCNRIVDADVGMRHSVDGETTDSVRKKRINTGIEMDAESVGLDAIKVTRLTTTRGFRVRRTAGNFDKTSKKFVTNCGSKAASRHGHSEMDVVNSIKLFGLRLLRAEVVLNESANIRIDAGGSKQNTAGDIVFITL